MGSRHDAALAAVAFVATAVAAAALDAPVTPAALAVGVVGALLLEGVLSLRPDAVRRVWDRRSVQVVALVLVAVGGPAAAFVVGGWVLTVLAAGLCTYLAALGVVHRS